MGALIEHFFGAGWPKIVMGGIRRAARDNNFFPGMLENIVLGGLHRVGGLASVWSKITLFEKVGGLTLVEEEKR